MARKITIKDGEIRTEGWSLLDTSNRSGDEFAFFASYLKDHIVKAERKHPLFSNKLVYGQWSKSYCESKKEILKRKVKFGNCDWSDVLMGEIAEAQHAMRAKDYAAAIDELMDCAAVIYRQVAVVRELMKMKGDVE